MFDWDNEKNNAKDWAKTYKGTSVMYEGIATYKDESVYLSKDTLKRVMPELKGRPVIIEHKLGINPGNMENYAVGYVTKCEYNNETGDFDCDFVTWDEEAKALLNNGYTLSTSYKATEFNNGGTYINTPYDREITDLEFTHLAIVKNPRYEKVKVYQNSTEELENDKWVTKFDKEGEPYHFKIEDEETSDQFKEKIMKTEIKKYKPTKTVIDWGKQKQQGKRIGNMVVGAMGDISLQGKKEYTRILGGLPEYEEIKDDFDSSVEGEFMKLAYLKAREYGFDKEQSLLFAYSIGEKENLLYKKLKNKPEKQNDIFEEKEYHMEKIEVEQGFFAKLLELASKKFSVSEKQNSSDEDTFEYEGKAYSKKELVNSFEKANQAKLEEDEEVDAKDIIDEDEEEQEEKEEKPEKEEKEEKKEKQNSSEPDWFELMQEKLNSVERGADDKIQPVATREKALEKGRQIYG